MTNVKWICSVGAATVGCLIILPSSTLMCLAQPQSPDVAPSAIPEKVTPTPSQSDLAPIRPNGLKAVPSVNPDDGPKAVSSIVPAKVLMPALSAAKPPEVGVGQSVVLSSSLAALPTLPPVKGVSAQHKIEKDVSLVLPLLISGQLTVEQAVEKEALSPEDAIYIIDNKLHKHGGFGEGWYVWWPLRRAVASVAASALRPEWFTSTGSLSQSGQTEVTKLKPKVRLWIGDYWQNTNDARCVPLLESVLAEVEKRTPLLVQDEEDLALVCQASERLGWFYSERRQYEQGAQIWLRLAALTNDAHWKPDALWQAGRMYLWAGKPQQSEPYFAQANAQGDKFFASMVSYDKAGALMSAGRNAEARQLVTQTLNGLEAPVDRAIQLMLLAQANYSMGDFAQAEKAAQQCLDEAAKTSDVNPMIGFDVIGPTAQDLAKWSQLWQKTPLICSPESLNYKTDAGKSARRVRVTVRSFKAVPLSVKCDDVRVKSTVVPLKDDPWFPRRETRFAEQIIEVEVPLATALQTELHISSAQLPGASCDIPLQISP